MAVRFIEGFQWGTDITQRWTQSGGVDQYITGSGRFGNGGESTNGNRGIVRTLSDYRQEWIVGFAFKVTNVDNCAVCTFRQDTTQHLQLYMTVGGALGFGRSNGNDFRQGGVTTHAQSVNGLLTANVWNYIEIYGKIDDSAGAGEIRFNGVTVASATSVDTRNGASALANAIEFMADGAGLATTWTVDDIYIVDTSGSAPTNTFLGDVRVETLMPNGNGNASDFTGSDGNSTDNYLLVDEGPPNEDTDYVQGGVVGYKDTYAYTNLVTADATIYGVNILPRVRKTDAGSRSVVAVARSGSNETDSAAISLGTSYVYANNEGILEAKPGGGAWTISDVNAAEFGVKVSA